LGAAAVIYQIRHPPRKTFAVALAHGDPTEPSELGYASQSVTFTLPDGTTTPGWIIDGRSHDGPTVIIVHGYGDSRYGALSWLPLVAPHAQRVVLFDLPGQGESQAKASGGGLREPADVLAVLDQIDAPQGAVLFGYSMGAGIAIAAAAQAGQRIVGVIADGPYRDWDEPLRSHFRARRYPIFPILPLAGLILRWVARGFDRFDRAAYAAQVRGPLLVLHGSEDELCPIESARAIALTAPRGRLVEFPGGHHLDLASIDAPRYRAALEAFFREIRQPSASTTTRNTPTQEAASG
ncbi:MAG TPA: alpha/beta fold hydrolase, partial [Phycisphaeraceae bacterium]